MPELDRYLRSLDVKAKEIPLKDLLLLAFVPIFKAIKVRFLRRKLAGIERDIAYYERQRSEGLAAESWLHKQQVLIQSDILELESGRDDD